MIEDIIKRHGGKLINANEWWPDGAWDQRERIVELPWHADWQAFEYQINRELTEPVQYIANADDNTSRSFLYYAE